MTKISIYKIDEKVAGNDKWIGSDAQNQYATKNFTPAKLAEYFNENQVIDIGASIRYRYDILEIGDTRLPGTITFNPQVGTPYSFSNISTFLLSKYTLKGNDVTEYLNFLIGTKVLISKSSDVNKFGYFSVVSIEEYIPEPNFFEVTLEYITGNGSIEEDRDYLISLIDVSTGGGPTPTLDEVLTEGNTSDESIILTNPYTPDYTLTNTLTSLNSYYEYVSPTETNYIADYAGYGIFLTTDFEGENRNSNIDTYGVNLYWSKLLETGSVNLSPGEPGLGGGKITFYKNDNFGSIRVNDITANVVLEFPNKSVGTYTIATTDDIPTIGTWGILDYPIWLSGTPFVKMTADGIFSLDTNTYLTTAVTSIGITVPPAFSVTPSSITTSGTFAITGAGTASQYIRGDGQLATFPTSGGGGSSVFYYLNGSVAASVATYKQMSNAAVIGTGTDFSLTGNGLIAQFLTDAGNPNRLEIPGGAWNFEMFFSMSSNGGTPKFYVELLKYDGAVFTSIANGSLAPETISGGTLLDLYLSSLAVPTTTLLLTDRLAVRVYIVNNSGGRTATLHTEDGHLCQIITTFSSGISAINGLTSNNQYLAVGTSGTDFNIDSALETHTFNLPSASATARGLVTTEAQTLAGAKTLSTTPILSSLTASQLLALDASKNVQSLDTATYPSLTELSYVKGATSSIQTQLNNSVKNIVKNAVQKTVTGTVVNTMISSYLIPANTFVAGDTLKIDPSMFTRSGTGTMTIRIYINSIESLTGATIIAASNPIIVTQFFTLFTRHYSLNGTNLRGYPSVFSTSETSPVTTAMQSVLYDLTQSKYIIFAVTNTISTDIANQESINITN
jgi:hypothetical protein